MADKTAEGMIHSDSELATKMGPGQVDFWDKLLDAQAEAGPSNTELVENSHSENGASPVLDGDLKSPERANINAIREAIETQAEMEVRMPITEKQQEVEAKESAPIEVESGTGKQIIINIAHDKTASRCAYDPKGNCIFCGKPWDKIRGDRNCSGKGKLLHPKSPTDKEKNSAVTSGISDINDGAPNFEVRYKFHGKDGKKRFSSQAVVDAFLKAAAEKFGSKFAVTPGENRVLPQDVSEGAKAHFFNERRIDDTGHDIKQVQCLDCGEIGEPGRNMSCLHCGSKAITDKIYIDEPRGSGFELGEEDKKSMNNTSIQSALKDAALPETPEFKHQLRIALDTLKMPPAMGAVMGGMTVEQAKAFLDKYGIKYKTSKEVGEGMIKTEGKKQAYIPVGGEPNTPCARCGRPIAPGSMTTNEGMGGAEQHVQCPSTQIPPGVKPATASKVAGLNFFFPGQALKEFYPEIQHEIVDYPNANNSPMGEHAPEMVGDGGHDMEAILDKVLDNQSIVEAIQLPGDVGEVEPVTRAASTHNAYVSTSPAGGMGIGRDGKPQIQEGVPLRKENDIRGPMFTDEFYGQTQNVPGKFLAAFKQAFLEIHGSASANDFILRKVAADDDAKQFAMFLKKVCGEIAATMVSAFKTTSRPLLDKVPGVGEIQLAQVEQPQGMSAFNNVNAGSRVRYILEKINDSEVKDAINDSWAQAAVWSDSGQGSFVYEVFVRLEAIDTDSLIAKYKFICGTREG